MIAFWIFAAVVFIFGFVVAFGAPYVPSLRKEVRKAFEDLYPIGENDVIVDLGSGDGSVLVEAARLGAKGYGYELNPVLVLISRLRLKRRARIAMANLWNVDLPKETTLVYIFAVTRDTKRFEKYLQAQANMLGRELKVMTFGAELKRLKPLATARAHALYSITPTVKTNE